MNNSDYDPDRREMYYERYTSYSDRQIKEILKNHHDYQESAVSAAIKIAIERELIHSDQDLMAPEYQIRASHKLTAFPQITDEYQYNKIKRSIFRILFFVSFIPIIFGILKYAEGQFHMTYLATGVGFVWLALTYALLKTHKMLLVFIEIILLLLFSLAMAVRLSKQTIFPVTDMLVLVIFTGLIIYFLLYLRKLILYKPEPETEP